MLELTLDRTASDAQAGFVGDRQLLCVQTFDIARLTTHPVVLRPGTFIAVGGRGPRGDSNESGKTSFLAATGLLLGDPEWRMTGGGPAASSALLFEPETAGVSAHTYAAARQGYIIGVFANPEHPEETALTVCCRINATSPYFLVRYADGVHLVEGETNRERYENVDAYWESMPPATQLGAHHYAEKLYGDSPRCLAYVSRRGKQRSAPSLLQMNAGSFSTEQIGDDLIRLTGRAAAFATEAEQRQRLDEAQRTLKGKQQADERARREEDEQLEGVLARNAARAHLAEAQRVWRLHFARGYLDVLDRERELSEERHRVHEQVEAHARLVQEAHQELDAMVVPADLQQQHNEAEREASSLSGEMDEAKQASVEARLAVDNACTKVRELDAIADGWTGRSATEVEAQYAAARAAAEEAQQSVGAAKSLQKDAEARLYAAESGTEGAAGATAQLLRDQDVQASPLPDVEIAESAREVWEPRLSLYERAVVVAPGQFEDALIAASDSPGAVLIDGEDAPLPDGVTSAPAGAAGFLARLENLTAGKSAPSRAEHAELGLTVIGGFAELQTGRAARLERARQNLDQARALVEEAQSEARTAALRVELLGGDLARARAAEQLPAAREELRSARETAANAKRAVDELVSPLSVARERHLHFAARLEGYDLALKAAEERLQSRESGHSSAVREERDAHRRLDALQVEYWKSNWGESAEAAATALAGENRREKTLRNRGAELLQDALSDLSIQSDGTGAPNEALAEVARRRSLLQDDPERGRLPATLGEVAQPLRDFLESHEDQDLVIEERVLRAREQRAAELELAVEETQRLDSALLTLQDGVEQRIRQALETISNEYDRLNRESGGFGADLHIEARRPEGPTDRWRWAVTPRWKRSANGRSLPYDNQANTAQEKLATVQLVLAALLAAPNPRGRVLVLDELGDSLGVSHRREVLREIAATAKAKGVTVLGTCQDSVMTDAAGYCGELVYFEYPSFEEALNRPTRMFGFDESRERVELTAHALRSGRPLV